MSLGDGRRGNRYLDTRNSSSLNHRSYHSSDNGSCGYRSHETSHSFSCNRGVYHFDIDGRGGTRSQETATIPLEIVEQEFMLEGEVDIGFRSATLPHASQEVVIYCWVSHFILVLYMKIFNKMIEVYIMVMDMRRGISVVMMVMRDKM